MHRTCGKCQGVFRRTSWAIQHDWFRSLIIEFGDSERFTLRGSAGESAKFRAVIRAKQIAVFQIERTNWAGLHLFLPGDPTETSVMSDVPQLELLISRCVSPRQELPVTAD